MLAAAPGLPAQQALRARGLAVILCDYGGGGSVRKPSAAAGPSHRGCGGHDPVPGPGHREPGPGRRAWQRALDALHLPGSLPRLGFAWSLVPVFAVAALASCAKTVGDLRVFKKPATPAGSGPTWRRCAGAFWPRLWAPASPALWAASASGTSTACIGLSIATRTLSRAIVVLVGLLAMVLGCIPVLAALFLLIPEPVQGAMVLFVVCFLMISGFQLITARMLNTRRTFVVGTSLAAGLGVQIVPHVFHGLVPAALESGITLTALIALLLNYITGLGSTGATELELTTGPGAGQVIFKELERDRRHLGSAKRGDLAGCQGP